MTDPPEVGKLAPPNAARDAIHIAVAPVIAGERLRPSQRVGLDEHSGRAYGDAGDASLGIVDPFYPDVVEEGERFWLFLFPNTITGMRHIWSHPAFKTKPPPPARSERRVDEGRRTSGVP